MNRCVSSRRGQIALEAGFIMLFLLMVLISLWVGGPIQQSTERSTDTNGILLAEHFLDEMESSVEMAGMGGRGERRDFVVHVPFNTVDIAYGEGAEGPHVNITVLLYNNLTLPDGSGFNSYYVDAGGHPAWLGSESVSTPFLHKTLTRRLKFPIADFPFCDFESRKSSLETRGPATKMRSSVGAHLMFCCEAGFNVHAYVERKPGDPGRLAIKPRHYYHLDEPWTITP